MFVFNLSFWVVALQENYKQKFQIFEALRIKKKLPKLNRINFGLVWFL